MYFLQQPEVREELERARQVFTDKAMEQGRQMAWVIANIYTQVCTKILHFFI